MANSPESMKLQAELEGFDGENTYSAFDDSTDFSYLTNQDYEISSRFLVTNKEMFIQLLSVALISNCATEKLAVQSGNGSTEAGQSKFGAHTTLRKIRL